jgi:hypothetical protein
MRQAADHYAEAYRLFREADILDDELMSGVRLARVVRHMGDDGQYQELVERLSSRVGDVESANAAAHYDMLRLEEFVEQNQAPDIGFVEKCERTRQAVTERPLQIAYDALLYRAWRLVEDNSRAESTFRRFHAIVKEMVSGLPSGANINRFLAQSHIADTFAHYRMTTRVL